MDRHDEEYFIWWHQQFPDPGAAEVGLEDDPEVLEILEDPPRREDQLFADDPFPMADERDEVRDDIHYHDAHFWWPDEDIPPSPINGPVNYPAVPFPAVEPARFARLEARLLGFERGEPANEWRFRGLERAVGLLQEQVDELLEAAAPRGPPGDLEQPPAQRPRLD